MNENISFNMGVKSAVPFKMGKIFAMYCMKIGAKVLGLNYNNVNINKIDMRSEVIDDMYRLILNMHNLYPSLMVYNIKKHILYLDITIKLGYELCKESNQYGYVFTTRGVIQNGCIFRYPTDTSGHFYFGVVPPGLISISECPSLYRGAWRSGGKTSTW